MAEKAGENDDETARQRAEFVARAKYDLDSASQAMGFKLERVAPREAEMSMVVREDMVNGHGTCHGGIIFSLADSTFAFADNTHEVISVASVADIIFVRPAYLGDKLIARGRETYYEGRNGIFDVEVRNADEQVIAQFRGKSRTTASPVPQPEDD